MTVNVVLDRKETMTREQFEELKDLLLSCSQKLQYLAVFDHTKTIYEYFYGQS